VPSERAKTQSKTYRLPVDLIQAVDQAALAEGQGRTSGRMFNPSAIVERALREYLAKRPPKSQRRRGPSK
jgi:hypothetical protein